VKCYRTRIMSALSKLYAGATLFAVASIAFAQTAPDSGSSPVITEEYPAHTLSTQADVDTPKLQKQAVLEIVSGKSVYILSLSGWTSILTHVADGGFFGNTLEIENTTTQKKYSGTWKVTDEGQLCWFFPPPQNVRECAPVRLDKNGVPFLIVKKDQASSWFKVPLGIK